MTPDIDTLRQWWNAKAGEEESDKLDEPINRALRWREIERHLAGVETILSVGGGTGAFSVPLAKRGFDVTHLDLSPQMIELARGKTDAADPIRFVEGDAADLSRFADASFDLVLNMDGAVSFSGERAERAILESCRVTRRTFVLTTLHQANLAALALDASIQVSGRLMPAVYAMARDGWWDQNQFPDNALLAKGCTTDYMPPFRAFLPHQVRAIVAKAGLRVLRCGGLATLAGMCKPETVQRLLADEALLQEFVDLCDEFDLAIMPDGKGSTHRAGLIAVAERPTTRD